jgi:hypothetical protein
MRALTDRDLAVLRELSAYPNGARPMDLGGTNGSHHGATLRKLVQRGLATRTLRSAPGGARASYRYWLSGQGRALLAGDSQL